MEEAPDSSQIIYSGGDDVFIVAHWEDALRIAERISRDFKEFTCHNPSFSISGGVALVRKKFPVMKAAEYSNQEESRGKKHVAGGKEKNALSFMNTPLKWTTEFPQVKSLKNSIVSLTDSGKLPKSFISKVLQITSNAQIDHHKIGDLKTYWMMAYSLGRMKTNGLSSECKVMIDHCIQEVCHPEGKLNGLPLQTNYHPLELWAFAARWAELELRTN
jgi:CRISPR-associated protein Csm1